MFEFKFDDFSLDFYVGFLNLRCICSSSLLKFFDIFRSVILADILGISIFESIKIHRTRKIFVELLRLFFHLFFFLFFKAFFSFSTRSDLVKFNVISVEAPSMLACASFFFHAAIHVL